MGLFSQFFKRDLPTIATSMTSKQQHLQETNPHGTTPRVVPPVGGLCHLDDPGHPGGLDLAAPPQLRQRPAGGAQAAQGGASDVPGFCPKRI